MDRVSMVGTVLVALLLMTTPVAATASVASQSGGPGQSGMHVATAETDRSAPSEAVSLNDTDGNETSGENTTTDSSTPCCGGGGPADRPVWKYDSNYDAEINYSEAYDSYQDYLDDIVTWETYLNVSEAYDDNETVLYPDPDGDGMTIREEEIWSDYGGYFAKYSTNLDDDQFSDFADPRPNTEDIPPNISVSFPDGIWDSYVNVTFSDENGIQEWEIIERYESRGELHTIDQPVTSFEVFDLTDNITVRAVDNNGNEREILLNITENDDVRLMRSEIAAAGLTPSATYAGGSIIGSISGSAKLLALGATTGTVAGVSAILAAPISQLFKGKNTDGTEEMDTGSMTTSQTYATFSGLAAPVESAVGASTVSHPDGYHDSVSDPAGGSLHRGYGWEFVQAASTVGYYQLNNLLTHGSNVEYVYENGEKTVVIGDNGYGGTIAITIVGGVVQAAQQVNRPVENDGNENCVESFTVETENEVQSDPDNDNPEHAIRDDKPINSLDKLDDAIKNPSRIVDFEGVRRYLIKKYDSGKVVIFALNKNKNPVFNKIVYELGTQLIDESTGTAFDTIVEAVEYLKNEKEEDKDVTKDVTPDNC
jgi:energy-coupling factor transporter ATP-binding protein EcfA2